MRDDLEVCVCVCGVEEGVEWGVWGVEVGGVL